MRNHLLTASMIAIIAGCGGEAAEQAATTEEPQDYAGADANATAEADAEAVAALADYYETHFNMGHGSMVADKFAEQGLSWNGNGGMVFGREAIAMALDGQIEAMSPEIHLDQQELLLFGDMAASRGSFSLTGTLDGETITNTGNYMSLSARGDDGTWLIEGGVSNLDSETQTVVPGEAMDMPPGEGAELLADVVAYYITHFNLGHGSMVAERYTEDAVGMFSGAPALMGRAAIEARMTELADAGVQVQITPWSARQLDDDHIAGVGTYTLETPDGDVEGHFAGLWKRGDDGVMRAHRILTSNHAPSM